MKTLLRKLIRNELVWEYYYEPLFDETDERRTRFAKRELVKSVLIMLFMWSVLFVQTQVIMKRFTFSLVYSFIASCVCVFIAKRLALKAVIKK